MEVKQKIKIYMNSEGKSPFIEWLESLDKNVRYRVKERLDRLSLGNFGDHKSIKAGIYELRLFFGSGYRIYYAKEEENILLLLSGGNKSSQKKDILKAISYWQDYLMR